MSTRVFIETLADTIYLTTITIVLILFSLYVVGNTQSDKPAKSDILTKSN